MAITKKRTNPELVLACQVNPSFETTENLETSLQMALESSVQFFDFWRAALVLVREGKPPVWWHAENYLMPRDETGKGCWITLYDNLNQCHSKPNKLLKPIHPVAYTTLPVILQAGDPVGTMEVGVFGTDPKTAEYMLIKGVSLGRHMADIIQESLFEKQKDRHFRKLAAWLEMISTISSTLDIRQVLHVVTQLTADLFFARCCIYMLDENTETIIPAVAVGSYDNELKVKFKALKNCRPFPVLNEAIKTQRPVIVTPDNIKKYYPSNIIKDFNYSWMVVAPIVKKDKVLGIMQVDRPYGMTGFDPEAAEIIFAIARATAIAIENAKLIEELGQKEKFLHHLVDKIITAQEDERKRLASDLHDGIIQSLIAIWYRLQRIAPDTNPDPGQWYHEISDLTKVLGEQIQDIRRILYDLRPIILDNYGLVPAIQSYAHKIQEQNGLRINLSIQGEDVKLPPRIEITLFRILQEAITNVIKHSGATLVSIDFNANVNQIQMSVRDNGTGFKKINLSRNRKETRLGLASIQERALLLNGTCTINSRPDEGTQVKITIPLQGYNHA